MSINIGKDLASLNRRIHHQMNQYHNSHESLDLTDKKMSRAAMGIIIYIYEHKNKDVYQKDIEKEFSVRRSTASSVITNLEENGYIKRVSTDDDKRLKKLVLTDKASSVTKDIKESHEFINEKLTKGISNEELERFRETLAKMKKNLED